MLFCEPKAVALTLNFEVIATLVPPDASRRFVPVSSPDSSFDPAFLFFPTWVSSLAFVALLLLLEYSLTLPGLSDKSREFLFGSESKFLEVKPPSDVTVVS